MCSAFAVARQTPAFPGLFKESATLGDSAGGQNSCFRAMPGRQSRVAIFQCPEFASPAARDRFVSAGDRFALSLQRPRLVDRPHQLGGQPVHAEAKTAASLFHR
jgi:hypothetical protein